MKYNVKLSKGKININGKDYDIPREVAEFIIYETSTRDDIIQARDVYERTIDKAIEFINECMRDEDDDTDIDIVTCLPAYKVDELLDILKVVR